MDELTHRVLDFYSAYYRGHRNVLGQSSWGALDMPLALRPKYRLVMLIETDDGFVVRHFDSPNPRNSFVFEAENEVFYVNPPFHGTSVSTYTGLAYQPDSPFFEVQFFEEGALGPDNAERQDAVTKVRVAQWSTEEAELLALEHLSPFVELPERPQEPEPDQPQS